MTLNLANLFEAVASEIPRRTALVCGDQRLSFSELDERANALAHHLRSAGVEPHQHVGIHLLNGTEFVESLLACLKIRAVPITINYRYTDRELQYLYNDADLVALIVADEFEPSAAAPADQCPKLRHVTVLGDPGSHGTASGGTQVAWPDRIEVVSYEEALAGRPRTAPPADGRAADDRYILYTGGTTGMPKGVVWRHEDFYFAALSGANPYGEPYRTAKELAAAATANQTPMSYLITAPLMHGAAGYTLFTALFSGSPVILMRRYDPVETLRLVERESAVIVTVVGDAIARPLVDAVREHGPKYDLSSWKILGSGGALLSRSVREDLAGLIPGIYVSDGFGASESGVDGRISVGQDGLLRLAPNPRVSVVDTTFTPLAPGSGEVGFIARTGHVPLGYYNDSAKTAKTFPVVDGVRWVVGGDMAYVEADGTVVLLGRGSNCINTGGEKVFPEEVEQALKSHPAVMDVLVAGVPDERYGERVAAVVELRADAARPTVEELQAHCRAQIAGYKVPRSFTFVDGIVRSPSGKADYRWAKRVLSGATS